MAQQEKTVTRSIKLSNKKHHRSVHFSYADDGADSPGDLCCQMTIQAQQAGEHAVNVNGYLNADNPRGLSPAELDQLNGLLDKLFAASIKAEGFK